MLSCNYKHIKAFMVRWIQNSSIAWVYKWRSKKRAWSQWFALSFGEYPQGIVPGYKDSLYSWGCSSMPRGKRWEQALFFQNGHAFNCVLQVTTVSLLRINTIIVKWSEKNWFLKEKSFPSFFSYCYAIVMVPESHHFCQATIIGTLCLI